MTKMFASREQLIHNSTPDPDYEIIPDRSLLIPDDLAGRICQVTYHGPL